MNYSIKSLVGYYGNTTVTPLFTIQLRSTPILGGNFLAYLDSIEDVQLTFSHPASKFQSSLFGKLNNRGEICGILSLGAISNNNSPLWSW
jgi:hypothetical protein